jgi:hypothetical protein
VEGAEIVKVPLVAPAGIESVNGVLSTPPVELMETTLTFGDA